MLIPELTLAQELATNCECGRLEQPVAVDGQADNPKVIYKCMSCSAVWIAYWKRGYQKVNPDLPTPTSDPLTSNPPLSEREIISYPVPPSPTPRPELNPVCTGCNAPLGSAHSPTCPYGNVGV